jgi:hypothetical protein
VNEHGGPNDITRSKDGNLCIALLEDGDKPAYVCVRDANGTVLARMESRHVRGLGVTCAATSTPN